MLRASPSISVFFSHPVRKKAPLHHRVMESAGVVGRLSHDRYP